MPLGLDTDVLGTFSGEEPRPGAFEKPRLPKSSLGAVSSGHELALPSEGAYGPHPTVPFVAGGLELVVFLDTRSERIDCEDEEVGLRL